MQVRIQPDDTVVVPTEIGPQKGIVIGIDNTKIAVLLSPSIVWRGKESQVISHEPYKA